MKIKKPLKDFRLKRNIHAYITPDFFINIGCLSLVSILLTNSKLGKNRVNLAFRLWSIVKGKPRQEPEVVNMDDYYLSVVSLWPSQIAFLYNPSLRAQE